MTTKIILLSAVLTVVFLALINTLVLFHKEEFSNNVHKNSFHDRGAKGKDEVGKAIYYYHASDSLGCVVCKKIARSIIK